MKYLKKPQAMAIWKLALIDLLLIGVILLTFAFFHHVLPALTSRPQNSQISVPTEPTQPSETEPTMDTTDTEPTESEAVTEPDNRTPWQIRFADHFTDEIVITENSYTSPEVSITIDTVVTGEGGSKVTYYVADIYVASLENFKTYTAHGEMRYFDTQPALEMVQESNAILAISGDFLTYQKSGFLLRNGETYVADRNYSICALFPDGTMETYDWGAYDIEAIMSREPLQVWSFGPVLLDSQGNVRESYDVSQAVGFPNPRSAIGYYEPGHYCFVVVDGRQEGHSAGVKIPQLAQIFADLGCTAAYNLDGGGTAVMLFDQRVFSRQSNGGRDLGDILLITESGYRAAESEGDEQ